MSETGLFRRAVEVLLAKGSTPAEATRGALAAVEAHRRRRTPAVGRASGEMPALQAGEEALPAQPRAA